RSHFPPGQLPRDCLDLFCRIGYSHSVLAPMRGMRPRGQARNPEKWMDARSPERGREGPVTSLIFPTYTAGPVLERTWGEVARFLRDAPGNWEVLFVCDGCTDDSPARLLEWSRACRERIRVVSYAPNRGKGYAVRRGLEAATGAWRLFTD